MGAPAKDRGFKVSVLDAAPPYFDNLKRQSHQMLSRILTIMTLSIGDAGVTQGHIQHSLSLRYSSALF
jgi:hypothetical protein